MAYEKEFLKGCEREKKEAAEFVRTMLERAERYERERQEGINPACCAGQQGAGTIACSIRRRRCTASRGHAIAASA